jgi:condensin complex subunit 2
MFEFSSDLTFLMLVGHPSATPQSKKRQSFGGFLSPKASPRSTPLTKEERKRSFEEWLKIAADNKINGQNTWNLALIDYFADMSLLREGDSINFQKASYTLDGCVKVYTSRIDSVDSETKKLLLGLTEREDEELPEEGAKENSNSTKRRKVPFYDEAISEDTL